MAKIMKALAVVFTALTALFTGLYVLYENAFVLSMGITFGTFSYHLLMRLGVGTVFDLTLKNRVRYTAWWFRERKLEKGVYQFLRVKKWKKHVPTYDLDTFSAKKHSMEELVMATCQSELVHEVIILLSFLPLLFAIPFGEFFVFLFTSLAAALFDCTFVIVQRFNRPRLVKLLKREKNDLD